MDPTQLDDGFERQFFEYVLDVTVLANAVQQQASLQIFSDADFEWWWSKVSRTSALLKLLMQETASSRNFIGTTAAVTSGAAQFNGINIDNWAGTAAAAGAWPLAVPYVMPASRSYLFLLSDTSGAPNVVEIVFSGYKLWKRPASS
jgi:hypothetical protein